MRVTAGFLQINRCTKPTLRVTLQANFKHISTLNYMVCRLPYYYTHCFTTVFEIREVKKYLHPQCHLQTINIMELTRACMEQEIK